LLITLQINSINKVQVLPNHYPFVKYYG